MATSDIAAMMAQAFDTVLVCYLPTGEGRVSPVTAPECHQAAAEITRLRAAIDAALAEFAEGNPLLACNCLLKAKEPTP